jgi:membrane protease YdiL (CAAX protease family)
VSIRQDKISKKMIVGSVMLVIFMYLFVGTEPWLVPFMLLAGSAVINKYGVRNVSEDPQIDQKESHQIFYYTLVALAGISFGSLFAVGVAPRLPASIISENAGLIVMGFSVLMAIAETQFFQGELLMLMKPLGAGSILASALVFTGYHWKVYGTSQASLVYVFVGGLALAYVAYKTRRITSSMIAHIVNNLGNAISPVLLVLALAGAFLLHKKDWRSMKWKL